MHILGFCRSIWNVRWLQHTISFYIRCPRVLFRSITSFTCERQIGRSWTKIESADYLTILNICSVQESALKDEICKLDSQTRKKHSVWFVACFFFSPSNLQQDGTIESWETESVTDCNIFPAIFFDRYFASRISVLERSLLAVVTAQLPVWYYTHSEWSPLWPAGSCVISTAQEKRPLW